MGVIAVDMVRNESFSTRFEDRGCYLYSFVEGDEDSVEVTLGYWKRIVDECVRLGFKRVLIEEDFPNQISTTEVWGAMNEIAKMLPVGFRVAFVDRQPMQEDINLFAETVAVNRGAYGRVFATVESADEWLRSAGRGA